MRRRKSGGQDQQIPTRLLGTRIPLAALVQALAVAEYLNFRHAAQTLGISQSSISARIKALEVDLGVVLFERHTRGVRLTDAGRHFVAEVEEAMGILDRAVKTAGNYARGEQGTLRMGVYALLPDSFLTRLLKCYRGRHPGIGVEIFEGTARDSIMQLRTDQLDITFILGSPEIPDCHSRQIWNERLLVVLPTNHALADRVGVTWVDLEAETFLVRRGGTGPQVYDHIVQRLAGCFPLPSIQRFDIERVTLLSMVAQGYGVTIVGEAISLMNTPGVAFLPILDEPDPLSFSAVWSPHNRSPALKSLIGLVGEMVRSPPTA